MEQSAPELPDGEIEGVGMKERPDVARVEVEPGAGGGEEASDVVVRDQSRPWAGRWNRRCR